MSLYVFAPAGAIELRNSLLKSGVEYIGSQQSGFGSSWAKGKRYIKKNVLCSGNAIKRACVVKNKVINHDFETYGVEVYYYHKDSCVKIVKFVLDYIVAHIDDPMLPQVFRGNDLKMLLKITYSHRISQVRWVGVQDYRGQGEVAAKLYEDLNKLG